MSRATSHIYLGVGGGYIALLSALILSGLLMVLTIAANSDAFIARANLSNTEDHFQAKHYATACGNIALRILNLDSGRIASSAPLQIFIEPDVPCTILSGIVSGNTASSSVRARIGNSVSVINFHATRASSTAPFIPTYWSELPRE
ncbi:hypothetical protein BH11PAT2_BH11PAT2_06550 [soil metagenome]